MSFECCLRRTRPMQQIKRMSRSTNTKRMITLSTAEEMFDISRRTIQRWAALGLIQLHSGAGRTQRVYLDELEALLRGDKPQEKAS